MGQEECHHQFAWGVSVRVMDINKFLSTEWKVVGHIDDSIQLKDSESGQVVALVWGDIQGLLIKLHYEGSGEDVPEILEVNKVPQKAFLSLVK